MRSTIGLFKLVEASGTCQGRGEVSFTDNGLFLGEEGKLETYYSRGVAVDEDPMLNVAEGAVLFLCNRLWFCVVRIAATVEEVAARMAEREEAGG